MDWSNLVKKKTFRNRLVISFSLLVVSLVAVTVLFFFFYTYRDIETRAQENLGRLAQRTANELESLFSEMDKLSIYISTNPGVSRAFQDFSKESLPSIALEVRILNILSSVSVPNSASRFRVSLFNHNANFITTGVNTEIRVVNDILQSDGYRDWYAALPVQRNRRQLYSHKDYWSSASLPYVSVLREIYSSVLRSPTGIVQVQAPYAMLEDILSFGDNGTEAYLILDPTQPPCYPYGLSPEQQQESFDILQQNASLGTTSLNLYCTQLSESGWTLILTEPRYNSTRLVQSLLLVLATLGVCMAGMGILFVCFVSWEVTRPLRQLGRSIDQVSLSNLSLQIPNTSGRDELTQLNDSFKNMFACLESSMNEIVQTKAHELQAHMVALQSQMDPHFLFNVIAIIKAMSHEKCNDDIEKVCDYLSDTLRYTSSYQDTLVPLGKELDNAENYLRIMQYRFEEKLCYRIEPDASALLQQANIPKLSLQPLLENCFQHAFAQKQPPWRITVQASIEGDIWRITVRDNGHGITAETIAQLEKKAAEFIAQPSEQILSLKLGGMGLLNTLVRLRLRYKEQMIFQIVTLPQGGSAITIGGRVQ